MVRDRIAVVLCVKWTIVADVKNRTVRHRLQTKVLGTVQVMTEPASPCETSVLFARPAGEYTRP